MPFFGGDVNRFYPSQAAEVSLAVTASVINRFFEFSLDENPEYLDSAASGDRARAVAASQTPLRRLAQLEEVAAGVAFLCGDQSSYITGTVLPISGGSVMPS